MAPTGTATAPAPALNWGGILMMLVVLNVLAAVVLALWLLASVNTETP